MNWLAGAATSRVEAAGASASSSAIHTDWANGCVVGATSARSSTSASRVSSPSAGIFVADDRDFGVADRDLGLKICAPGFGALLSGTY